jgi:hypothetical protein
LVIEVQIDCEGFGFPTLAWRHLARFNLA